MSVVRSDIVIYGSLNMPESGDATTPALTGGAVDFTKRVVFYDLSANDTINAVSSAAGDGATNVRIMVRDATGAVQTPGAVPLNATSTTPVTGIGGVTASHFLAAIVTGLAGNSIAGLANPAGTPPTGDVAVYRATPVTTGTAQAGGSSNSAGTAPALFRLAAGTVGSVAIGQIIRITSGTGNNQLRQIVAVSGFPNADTVAVNRDWTNVPAADTYQILQGMLFESSPNKVSAITRMFATSAADIAGNPQRIYYEKVFVVNNNTTTALTSAAIQIQNDTPALPISTPVALDIGLTAALFDSGTIPHRLTLPTGLTAGGFTPAQPNFINIPAPGNLPSGNAPNSAGAQGIWVRLTLPAGSTSYTGAANFRIQGTTT